MNPPLAPPPAPGARRSGRRRALWRLAGACAGLGLGGAGPASRALAQTPRLPLRNLRVEVRQAIDEQQTSQAAGVTGGGVVVGTGGVAGQAGLEWRSERRDVGTGATQQVLVLNGGQASVRVSAQTPWQFVQVAWTAQGPIVVPSVVWTESVTGFRVRPQWPGGSEPVTVELSAEAASPGAGMGGGPAPQAVVLSTVQVPLGEWVTVARSVEAQQVDSRGTLSSRSAERRGDRVLQVRVQAP